MPTNRVDCSMTRPPVPEAPRQTIQRDPRSSTHRDDGSLLQAGYGHEVSTLSCGRSRRLAGLGLRLGEAKRLTAAIQAEIVPAQVTIAGGDRRTCVACGRVLASKGTLQCNILFAVRRRVNPGSAPNRLFLPGDGRSKELCRLRPRGRDGGARTGLCDGAVCGAGAVWQGPRTCCRSCCRSVGRRTRARCATEPCGPVRPLCCRILRQRWSRRRRGRANPSWLDLMAATSAAGTARTSGILR